MTFTSVMDYLAGLPLTFEGCNLDHSLELEDVFQSVGDLKSAAIMRRIHEEEIEHVRFGLEWLRRLKPPTMTDWKRMKRICIFHEARQIVGHQLDEAARYKTGMDEEFVSRLKASQTGAVRK